jgi:hypothetical protein
MWDSFQESIYNAITNRKRTVKANLRWRTLLSIKDARALTLDVNYSQRDNLDENSLRLSGHERGRVRSLSTVL